MTTGRINIQILFLLILFATVSGAQQITIDEFPQDYRLYARGVNDSAEVVISGTIDGYWLDSLRVGLYKDDLHIETVTPDYQAYNGSYRFTALITIGAELSDYTFTLMAGDSLIRTAVSVVCGDVYLVNGQSNAVAYDRLGIGSGNDHWVRTYGTMKPDAAVCEADTFWAVADPWALYSHASAGVWPWRLGSLLAEETGIPIAIINGAEGGTTISEHQPGSFPYSLGTVYGRLYYRAEMSCVREQAKGMFWYQGESDLSIGFAHYQPLFDTLYRHWKSDFPALEKIYFFQIRPVKCPANGIYQWQLREIQRRIPERYDDVLLLTACGVEGMFADYCHYYNEGYYNIADMLYPIIMRDFYNGTDTVNIEGPELLSVEYSGSSRENLLLKFNQPIVYPPDTLGYAMKDYFYLDEQYGIVDSAGNWNDSTIALYLGQPASYSRITYLPNRYYHNTNDVYVGPWLKNTRGIGVPSFHAFPITDTVTSVETDIRVPSDYRLYNPYPQPFNNQVTISFDIGTAGNVVVEVLDLLGCRVAALTDDHYSPGSYKLKWDAGEVSSGLYFLSFRYNYQSPVVRKLLLLQ